MIQDGEVEGRITYEKIAESDRRERERWTYYRLAISC
jgi:hypothetical protein